MKGRQGGWEGRRKRRREEKSQGRDWLTWEAALGFQAVVL